MGSPSYSSFIKNSPYPKRIPSKSSHQENSAIFTQNSLDYGSKNVIPDEDPVDFSARMYHVTEQNERRGSNNLVSVSLDIKTFGQLTAQEKNKKEKKFVGIINTNLNSKLAQK